MPSRLFTGLMAVIALAGAAGAAPSLELPLGLCAAKSDAGARLACYDAIAAQLKAGEISTAAAPPTAAKPVSPEAQFGADFIAKDDSKQADEIDAISSPLKSFAYTQNGRAIVTLENGQVWRQIDGDSSKFRAKEGEVVKIARAIFSSYSMTVSSHPGIIKVRRLK